MRRASALSALLFLTSAALTATLVPATAASAAQPGRITIEGTYQQVVADSRSGHGHDERALLVTQDKAYTLSLPKDHRIKPGQKVRVKGRLGAAAGGPQAISADETTVMSTSTGAPSAAENQRVLVMLATWTAPDAVTPDHVRHQFFSDNDAWFREVSYGAVGLTGDVTPWLSIAGPTGDLCYTNHRQTMTQAKAAALGAGFDAAEYDRTVLYFPQSSNPDCSGYAGWAYQPGNEVWLNGVMDRRTTVHEIGHNLGLSHAHAYACTDEVGHPTAFSEACSSHEYGDDFDAMGASSYTAHFSAPQKAQLGWTAGRVVDLSDGGALLQPVVSLNGNVAAKVVVGTRTFWVEQRSASGADAALPSGATDGVLVRVTDPAVAAGHGLLDHSPDGSFFTSVLAHGSRWVLPDGRALFVGLPTVDGTPVSVGAVPTDTEAPGAVTNLLLAKLGRTQALTWMNPADLDFEGVVLLSKDGTAPSSGPGDGTVLYSGSGVTVSMPKLERGSTYTFTAFAHDGVGNFGAGAWITVSSGKVVASGAAV